MEILKQIAQNQKYAQKHEQTVQITHILAKVQYDKFVIQNSLLDVWILNHIIINKFINSNNFVFPVIFAPTRMAIFSKIGPQTAEIYDFYWKPKNFENSQKTSKMVKNPKNVEKKWQSRTSHFLAQKFFFGHLIPKTCSFRFGLSDISIFCGNETT